MMPDSERRRLIHLRWIAVLAVLFVQFGFYLDGRVLHRENEVSKIERAEHGRRIEDITKRFAAVEARIERMDQGGAMLNERLTRIEKAVMVPAP